jgi:hypothetical protein
MANVQPPSYGACDHTGRVLVSGESNYVLTPGVYCGGILLSSSTVTFSPGVYILRGGGLSVESGSHITGNGVSFYNTTHPSYSAGRIYISSNSTAQLSAPSQGGMMGILFYQNDIDSPPGSNSSLDPLIESGISSFFTGVLYFPDHMLSFLSNSVVNSGAAWTQIIVRRLKVSSNTELRLNVDNPASPVARATLAE